MRGQGEDPKQLAQDMSLRKLCYEIEKLEQEMESQPQAETTPSGPQTDAPPKKPPRQKHILSWLLDSSSEDES